MKKILITLSFAFTLVTATYAQSDNNSQLQNWYHQNFEKTGVYGVGTNDAIEFLKVKGLKPTTIIVGVIDSGVQVTHPDLKNNIWVNPNEQEGNNIDDDKNGYIDDINGWDFIGGKDGKDVNQDTMEATREVIKYEKLFATDNKSTNEANIKKYPKEYKEYKRAKLVFDSKLQDAQTKLDNMDEQQSQIKQTVSVLKQALGNKTITQVSADEVDNPNLKGFISMLAENEMFRGKTVEEFEKIALEEIKEGVNYYGNQVKYMFDKKFNPRSIIGDNYSDVKEKYYGNNEVEGPDALHGTHVSGIIAAERDNGIGMDGIAGDIAKILVVRAVPDGDERDKDIANAIFYAIDNGAKIINMSFGKSFSPEKERVWEAMEYAESKGVLMIHAAGNDNKNLDITYNYPTNFKEEGGKSFVNNWLTVGASTRYSNDKLKASFSNYGSQVDIFAPGLEIYSTIIKDEYKFLQGTSMAAPVVSGCAALLWAYFPSLTATEVRDILLATVNKSDEPLFIGEDADTTFDKLSTSGGIIDVYKAVKYAYEKYPNKANK